jgi:hypothetical protein
LLISDGGDSTTLQSRTALIDNACTAMADYFAGMYEMMAMKRRAAKLSQLSTLTPETVALVIEKEP